MAFAASCPGTSASCGAGRNSKKDHLAFAEPLCQPSSKARQTSSCQARQARKARHERIDRSSPFSTAYLEWSYPLHEVMPSANLTEEDEWEKDDGTNILVPSANEPQTQTKLSVGRKPYLWSPVEFFRLTTRLSYLHEPAYYFAKRFLKTNSLNMPTHLMI